MKKNRFFALVLSAALTAGAFFCTAEAASYSPADVNGDGAVKAEDARLCLRQAVGLESYAPGSAQYNACDVTGDGEVKADDARLILRIAVGLEQAPGQKPAYTANNEYDIYRSGTFYLIGTMTDGSVTQPLELAMAKDLVYMKADVDGMQMAIQIMGNNVYLIAPKRNAYFKTTKAELSMIGLDLGSDMPSAAELAALPALSEATSVTEGYLDGACEAYNFVAADGSRTIVYMRGDTFLGMDSYAANWAKTSSMRVTSITKIIPKSVSAPGGGGRRVWTLLAFMNLFS